MAAHGDPWRDTQGTSHRAPIYTASPIMFVREVERTQVFLKFMRLQCGSLERTVVPPREHRNHTEVPL